MDKSIDIQLKSPECLSKREQRVILETLEQHFQGRRFDNQAEGRRAVQAVIEEYMGFNTQFEPVPRFAWFRWVGLVALLLAGDWLYWIRNQSLRQ